VNAVTHGMEKTKPHTLNAKTDMFVIDVLEDITHTVMIVETISLMMICIHTEIVSFVKAVMTAEWKTKITMKMKMTKPANLKGDKYYE
jgi:hypothetical protein